MSILIKGIGMPQDCVDCPCVHDEYAYCKLTMNRIKANKPDWCPLKEVKDGE